MIRCRRFDLQPRERVKTPIALRCVIVLALAGAVLAGDPTTAPSLPDEQARFEQAQTRLADKLKARAAAATQPAGDHGTGGADDSGAIGAIHGACTDINSILLSEAGFYEPEADKSAIDASLGGLYAKSMQFNGSVFGVSDDVPGQHVRGILVLLTIPPPDAAMSAWRRDIQEINERHDVERQKEQKRIDSPTESSNNREVAENSMRAGETRRTDELRRARDKQPPISTIEVYLMASDEVIDSARKNQPISGKVVFDSGTLSDIERWAGHHGRDNYVGKIQLAASFTLDHAMPPKAATPASVPDAVDADPRTVVFVCRGTGSMIDKMPKLKTELTSAIEALKPTQAFNIVFFQDEKTPKLSNSWLPATPENKARAEAWVNAMQPTGTTDPIPALTFGLKSKPELLYFISGGLDDFPDVPAVQNIFRRMNAGHTVIVDTILIERSKEEEQAAHESEDLMREIAMDNGGIFKCVTTDQH
jgi:hypothetical protein